MSLRFPESFAAVALLLIAPAIASGRELRICADPDNLPFSNAQQQGFENRIAEIVARDLHAHLSYEWQRMGRGFVREYLNKSRCDVLIGIPARFPAVSTTLPYYRSTYVFVTRKGSGFDPVSLNDPSLHGAKIGVQALEEEYTPAAEALARRGMQGSLVGFYGVGRHAGDAVRAVAAGKVDLAIVWGPIAGYVARHVDSQLELRPVIPEMDPPSLPFTFEIAMGVKAGNNTLRQELDGVVQRHRAEIQQILFNYGVPQLQMLPRSEAGN
jgi:mxaJ protein